MIISTNWLSDYIKHGLTENDLADRLTMCGLEVESVDFIGSDLEGVVVGRVVSAERHPNADRLSVCQVDLGDGEPIQIVCGAPNVAAGQKVAVATIGTTLSLPTREDPSVKADLTMKQVKIRGEESNGMICAADELGLGEDHSGTLVLDSDAELGQAFGAYLSARGTVLKDAAIDISITPNRPDAISHLGIARDVAALTGASVNPPAVAVPAHGGLAAEQVSVTIEAPELCSRYVGVLVKGVTIKESPDWMKQRLLAIGLRPRNNVVDITNYVMYECGQPLHAFDFDQVAGHHIIVRQTSGETSFTTLDSKERALPSGTLMICDANREVAIAGIMGGENSEVSQSTSNVLIESAYFDPSTIRRTAKALGLQTDASYRFERGIDSEGQAWAAMRAAQLMVELAGGELVDGIVDNHPRPFVAKKVMVRAARVGQIVGVEIDPDEMVRLIEAIGFQVSTVTESPLKWEVTVPSFRPDVEREIDVIEEIARLYGFDNIPEPQHSSIPNFTPTSSNTRLLREKSRNVLSGNGYRETYTNSMLPAEVAEMFNSTSLPAGRFKGETVHTLNPITTEMSALRPSMLPGLLKVVGHNQNHGQTAVKLFEFGRVHTKKKTNVTLVGEYTEIESLIVAASGNWEGQGWYGSAREVDLFDLKGTVDLLLASIGMSSIRYADSKPNDIFDYGVDVYSGKRLLGTLGKVSKKIAQDYSIRLAAFVGELDWGTISELNSTNGTPRYVAVSRFPVVERDIAVVVEKSQAVGPMIEKITTAGSPLLSEALVFDVYEGKGIEDSQKSVAFGLRFAADRTLRDNEVDQAVSKVLKALEQEFGAQLR
ncbi:phenylalanine--tRNA ligase subunit beta [bacterium]|nr:phenylalanine--tRNA ligase subunit beta [bacterium]